MVVDTFIRRPILASVCSLVIILAGLIAIPTLPIAQFPELAPPQVLVTAFYNGADAQTVETAVTTPLEQVINGVEGMLYMTSTSGNDGTSAITITFTCGGARSGYCATGMVGIATAPARMITSEQTDARIGR